MNRENLELALLNGIPARLYLLAGGGAEGCFRGP